MTRRERRETVHEAFRNFLVEGMEASKGMGDVMARAIDQWNGDGEPRTPWERGCFEVIRQVFADMERAK